jgi:Holliday junction DNA helicase RuvB
MRPTTFEDFVGQVTAKKQLQILQKSAELRKAAIPHILFSGASGTGKSTAARIIAKDNEYVEVNAASINNIKKMVSILQSLSENSVLFLDEVHALTNKVQEFLYIVMEDFEMEVSLGSTIKRKELPKFTLIGATTHIGCLNPPMRNRFKHVVEFAEYELDELAIIVQRVARANLRIEFSERFAKAIAQTCKNNPRNVITRTEFIRDWIVTEGDGEMEKMQQVCKSMTYDDLLEIFKSQNVDEYGLEVVERKYLDVVREHEPISLPSICSKLGLSRENVLAFEEFLVKMDLIEITQRGRCLNHGKYREMYPLKN